ncbi:WD repeat protein [Talaromyces proteolyticus]|uniref:WD repeat protein n=1 Tax=Talaromyces proteolyticus TaxID=1131652 RepID=A0AAD4KIV5_9EURO|nr:WD repeat protein [Talaromyces proteolyticus]KAH8692446.1 WD repeat protein [Talaromyces proteolyticus]
MSPPTQLAHSAKRQRPTDGNQNLSRNESQNRSKRLKTRKGIQKETDSGSKSSKNLIPTTKSDSKWVLDTISHGEIYNTEPVFSSDENHIFLSLGNAIQVLSVSARRPIRTLQLEDNIKVAGIRPASDPRFLYISTLCGKLIQFDWESHRQVAKWTGISGDRCLEIVRVDAQGEERTACFSLKKYNGQWAIAVHSLWMAQSKNPTETVVLESAQAIKQLKVLQRGRVIVTYTSQHIIVGTLDHKSKKNHTFDSYTWKEFQIPTKQITCLDTREHLTSSGTPSTIDIAIGEASGAILIYQDILGNLNRDGSSSDGSKGGLPLLQRLHWHTDAVSSVCWSRDGNYIISGGSAPVVVFWQLESGRKNVLPHLSSSICSIAVSPGGAFYAIQLNDKSTVVLSATELEPVLIVNGLQLPSTRRAKNIKGQYSHSRPSLFVPTILHPHNPESLSVAVPGGDSDSLSFLQTLDIRKGSQISRQALTRTNITSWNTGPEGLPIQTPSIKFMAMSEDGHWLVTVDRWSPPERDLKAFGRSLSSDSHSEIFLKFWAWSKTQEIWELVTRVESPHLLAGNPTEILCLSARPGRHEFVTFGADKILKIWQPTARYSKASKHQPRRSGAFEQTWKCQTSVDFSGSKSDKVLENSAMGFSDDGSVLALSTGNVIQLVDTHQWAIYCTRSVSSSSSDSVTAVKFLKSSLVIQSKKSLDIWNVVDNCLKTVASPHAISKSADTFNSLAVNPTTETFSVIYSGASQKSTKASDKWSVYGIAVYNASTLTILFQTEFEEMPISLLSDKNSGDYIVIDAAASLKRVGCGHRGVHAVEVSSKTHEHQTAGLSDIFGRIGMKPHHTSTPTPVVDVNLKGIEGIFNQAPSFALPPASSLFKDVIKSLVTTS